MNPLHLISPASSPALIEAQAALFFELYASLHAKKQSTMLVAKTHSDLLTHVRNLAFFARVV